jgi:hypothetical protein
MKLAWVLSSRSANAGKKKLAGKRENSVGIEEVKDPVAGMRGVPLLKANEGTRGITDARVIPTLVLLSSQHFIYINQGDAYAIQSPNKKKARNLLVDHFPHIPRWSRLHAVHFSLLSSDFFSLFPALVMSASPTASILDPQPAR